MGCMPDISVEFDGCECIIITSSKDLSNVVLEIQVGLESGYSKFDNLTGLTGTFCVSEGESLKGAWIKSGCNHNEDETHPCPEGNGCGEYFSNPNYPCDEPEEPTEKDTCNMMVYTFGRNTSC